MTMAVNTQDLMKLKKEVLLPHLPFINQMMGNLMGTGLETKWKIMHECITSDKKRMSIEQIQKMNTTLTDLKVQYCNDRKKSHSDFDVKCRNTSPPQHSYRSDDAGPSNSYNRSQNDHRGDFSRHRKYEEDYRYRHNDRRSYENSSDYYRRKSQNFHRSHGSDFKNRHYNDRRHYDHCNFDERSQYNGRDHYEERKYDRSYSRRDERSKSRSFNRSRSKSKPYERPRSTSRAFENSRPKTDEVEPKSKTETCSENFLLTHPRFSEVSSKANGSQEKNIKTPNNKQADSESRNLSKAQDISSVGGNNLKIEEDKSVKKIVVNHDFDTKRQKDTSCLKNHQNIVKEKENKGSETVPEKIINPPEKFNIKLSEENKLVEVTEKKADLICDVEEKNQISSDSCTLTETLKQGSCRSQDETKEALKSVSTFVAIDGKESKSSGESIQQTSFTESKTLLESSIDIKSEDLLTNAIEPDDTSSLLQETDEISVQMMLDDDQNGIEKKEDKSGKKTVEIPESYEQINNKEVVTELLEKTNIKTEPNPTNAEFEQFEIKSEISTSPLCVIPTVTQNDSLKKARKTRKKMSELEKLQNDLNRSIDADSFMKIGIKPRSCTVQKPVNDNDETEKFQIQKSTKSIAKPRSNTLKKSAEEKTKEYKPCWVEFRRLNLTLEDMPVKVDSNFQIISQKSKEMEEEKKQIENISLNKGQTQTKSTLFTEINLTAPNISNLLIKPEPTEFKSIVFEEAVQMEEPVFKNEKVTFSERKASIDLEEKVEIKKRKISQSEEWEEEAPTVEENVKYENIMKLKKFMKYFHSYSAVYDKRYLSVKKLRKKQSGNTFLRSSLIETIVEEAQHVDQLEEAKTHSPIPKTDANKSNIANEPITQSSASALKVLIVKPIPRPVIGTNSEDKSTFIQRSTQGITVAKKVFNETAKSLPVPTKHPLANTSKQSQQSSKLARILPSSQKVLSPGSSSNNTNPLPTISNIATTILSSTPKSSNRLSVQRIPITLPSIEKAQQPIAVIDISDDDDVESAEIQVDSLRPWIDQTNFKTMKSEMAISTMKSKYCLAALYKCMGSTCCFYTSEKNHFQVHLELHRDHQKEDAINYLMCSYCIYRADNILGLIGHINNNHGSCKFSCISCFYRSANEFQVSMNHNQKYHNNENQSVIAFQAPVKREKSFDLKHVQNSISEFCQSLKCPHCSKDFYIVAAFMHHIQLHVQKPPIRCLKCQTSADNSNILQHHFNCYGYGLYQCVYCHFGASTVNLIDDHLMMKHPERTTYFVSRRQTESTNDRKNPSDISSLSLKEISKEEVHIEKIFVHNSESLRNYKNLFNLSDIYESDEEVVISKDTQSTSSSLIIQSVTSLKNDDLDFE